MSHYYDGDYRYPERHLSEHFNQALTKPGQGVSDIRLWNSRCSFELQQVFNAHESFQK